jgi:hypothetical protein
LDKVTGVWLSPTDTTGTALKDDNWLLLVPRIVIFTFTNHMQSERIAIDVLEPLAPRLAVIARKFMLPTVELFVDGSALDVNKPLFGQPLVKAPSTHCSPHATIIAMAGKSTTEARDDRSDTDRVATLRSVVRQRTATSTTAPAPAQPPLITLPPGTRLARATYDYVAEDDTELTLSEGDLLIVTLVGEEKGWWQGYKVESLTVAGGDTAAYNFPGGFVALVAGDDRIADLLRTFTSQRRRLARPDANSRRRMTAVRNRVSMAISADTLRAVAGTQAQRERERETEGEREGDGEREREGEGETGCGPLHRVSARLRVEKKSLRVLDDLLDGLYGQMSEERERQRAAALDAAVLRHKLDVLLSFVSPSPSLTSTSAVLLRKRLERAEKTHADLLDTLESLSTSLSALSTAASLKRRPETTSLSLSLSEATAAAAELSSVLLSLSLHRALLSKDLGQVASLILGMDWPTSR